MAEKIGGKNGLAILPYEYEIREAWGVTMDDNVSTTQDTNEDIKKPALYIIRKFIMWIVKLLTEKFGGGK